MTSPKRVPRADAKAAAKNRTDARVAAEAKAQARSDGWANTMSSLGGPKDKSTGRTYRRRPRLTRTTIDALYDQNPIAARVVDRIVDDATREGWKLEKLEGTKLTADQVMEELAKINVDVQLARAGKWSRRYGGALLMMPTKETPEAPPSQPLIKPAQLFPLAVIDADAAQPMDYDATFGSPTFQKVLSYQVNGAIKSFEIHHTRVIPFEPIQLPPETILMTSPNGWGPSVLDRLFDDLGRDGEARSNAVGMMYLASVMYFQMDGFRQEHVTKGGPERLSKMMSTMRSTLDSLGIFGMDALDSFGNVSHNMAGIHELISKMREALAAAADMPKEILFNESPAGLNAGELSGPQEIWFASVASYQQKTLTPALDRILEVFFASRGEPDATWSVVWEPLWVKSEETQAATNLQNATADKIMFDSGAVSSELIYQNRVVMGNRGALQVPDVSDEAEPLALDLSEQIEPADVDATIASLAPVAPGDAKVADEAMNGAQITSLVAIVQSVAAGALPRDAAIGIISAGFPSQAANAEAILGSAGLVAPGAPAVAVAPGAPVVEADAEEIQQAPGAPPEGETPLSAAELGGRLGVSGAVITGMAKRGEISGWKVGRGWRFLLSEVQANTHRPRPEADDGAGADE